ncbi:hypothetical protein ACH4JS_30925 [Streptomyces sp. NPDC017638]|uniref:hypothetical protein n=1 Tax=Streptomyces sp. NPDC017638 TaxID=3365004 RepID=UPI0037BC3716
MIGSWGSGDGRAGRSRRAVLLIGLVLVIAAHLTGAAQACSFAGPGPAAAPARAAAHPADTGRDTGPTGPPRHRHAADGHPDHTADRPRAALDDTGLADETHPPVLPALPRACPARSAGHKPPSPPRGRAGGPSLAAVRVLRQ